MKRGRPHEKRLKRGFFGIVIHLAVSIARIEILIEKVAEVDLVKAVPLPLRQGVLLCRGLFDSLLLTQFFRGLLLQHFLQDRVLHQLLVEHLLKFQLVELEELNFLKKRGGKRESLTETDV